MSQPLGCDLCGRIAEDCDAYVILPSLIGDDFYRPRLAILCNNCSILGALFAVDADEPESQPVRLVDYVAQLKAEAREGSRKASRTITRLRAAFDKLLRIEQ